jgi:hypothetical protein
MRRLLAARDDLPVDGTPAMTKIIEKVVRRGGPVGGPVLDRFRSVNRGSLTPVNVRREIQTYGQALRFPRLDNDSGNRR